MELDVLPEHLLVLGGGYIGLEFGQVFRRFGSAVTIVQRGPQLLFSQPVISFFQAIPTLIEGFEARNNEPNVVPRSGDPRSPPAD